MFASLLRRSKQYGFAVVFAGFLMVQHGRAQVPHTDAPVLSGNSQLHIDNWRVLGPFQFFPAPASADVMSTTGFLTDAARLGLSADYLLGYSTSEQRVTANSFPKIARSTRYSSQELPVENRILHADPGTHILTLLPDYTPVHFTVSYAVSVIDSPVDQDIVLAVGVEDTMRVTLDGSVIYDEFSPNFRLIRKVQSLFGAHLHRGANFLLVKQTNVKRKWLMTVTAYPRSAGLKVAREAGVSPLLRSAVIPLNHSIELRGDLVECHKPLSLDLEDAEHLQIAHFSLPCRPIMRWQPPRLAPNEVYFVHGVTDSGSTTEPIYYGSPDDGYLKMLSEVEAMHISDEEVRNDIATPLSRLRHLLLPENRTSEFWEQKIASLFLELHSESEALAVSNRTFLSLPGTHLRAYRSSVDAQVQNYWIHVPAKPTSAHEGLPLIFVMPGTPLKNLPFLESFQAAFYDEIQRFEMVSDESGAAVVQINGRGKDHGGTAIWESEVFDVLKAISANYPLDKRRIYLMGECEGGRQALLLAERHPGVFAAAAVIAPMPKWRHSSVGSVAIQENDQWSEYASPISHIEGLLHTPVFIRHEVLDEEVPIADSEEFMNRLRGMGGIVQGEEIHGGSHSYKQETMEVRRSLVSFLVKQHLYAGGDALSPLPKTQASSESIQAAFSSPILLVEGTLGTTDERTAIHQLSQQFREDWMATYFVSFPAKLDSQVTDQDIATHNLILVGDAKTNAIIHKLGISSPVHPIFHGLLIGDEFVAGDQLGYIVAVKPRSGSSRSSILIGMTRWQAAKDWHFYLARDGIRGYMIYDLASQSANLVKSGYLGPSWILIAIVLSFIVCFSAFLWHHRVIIRNALFNVLQAKPFWH